MNRTTRCSCCPFLCFNVSSFFPLSRLSRPSCTVFLSLSSPPLQALMPRGTTSPFGVWRVTRPSVTSLSRVFRLSVLLTGSANCPAWLLSLHALLTRCCCSSTGRPSRVLGVPCSRHTRTDRQVAQWPHFMSISHRPTSGFAMDVLVCRLLNKFVTE